MENYKKIEKLIFEKLALKALTLELAQIKKRKQTHKH